MMMVLACSFELHVRGLESFGFGHEGSGSRGRDKPKQDSRHWEESIVA